MLYRIPSGVMALAAALMLTITDAAAFDDSIYPAFNGQWRRAPGVGIGWDESKPRGLAQQPPLTPEYQKIWEASMADQEAGGQGNDTRITCVSNGMPRLMTIIRPLEFFIYPWITLVVYENNIPRRLYTDGRDFAKDEEPSFAGTSIGKWLDTDGDGKYDTLEVETRNFKGPRNYEDSGLPLHADNQSVIKERLFLDKGNPNILHNEITTYDHALTRPWTVMKNYHRVANPEWHEDLCSESNNHVIVGKNDYFLSGDGYLMPTKKNQPPPDLRYYISSKRRNNGERSGGRGSWRVTSVGACDFRPIA
jgi:hypothetical protein